LQFHAIATFAFYAKPSRFGTGASANIEGLAGGQPQVEICGYTRLTPSGSAPFGGTLVETCYPHKKRGRHLCSARQEMVNA